MDLRLPERDKNSEFRYEPSKKLGTETARIERIGRVETFCETKETRVYPGDKAGGSKHDHCARTGINVGQAVL
jgi:hypothetical protein